MVGSRHVSFVAPHPPIPADRVRFVGAVVAMVVAETPAAARDGAERVVVDWTPLPAVTASLTAAAPGAPILWDGTLSNVCADAQVGDAAAVELAFSRAAHVVQFETWVHRVTGGTMEPRAAIGSWDPASARYTVHAGAGGLGRTLTGVAGALGVPETAVRVVSGDVGGNFGPRNSSYPEFALVAWAAKRVGRPVKWTCERREAFLTDLIKRAGGISVTADVPGAFPRFSDEAALAAKPDAIILPTGGSMGEGNSTVVTALKNSPAVVNGRVYKINGDLLSRPGPRLVDGLEEMARALHPEAFK